MLATIITFSITNNYLYTANCNEVKCSEQTQVPYTVKQKNCTILFLQ